MKAKYKRLITLTLLLLLLFTGSGIIFFSLRNNIVFFYSPTEINDKEISYDEIIRIGGIVQEGSVEKEVVMKDNKKLEKINFTVTDLKNDVKVVYVGILPDLFSPGKGIVAEGRLSRDFTFNAIKVLAKHDENYMPPEIENSLFSESEDK
tara:strand:+ start:1861 stop:2310 length:450 start_codon:yes stop_codon:yes gene_type:complete